MSEIGLLQIIEGALLAPLRVGDTITSRTKLSDVKLRQGKLGEMFILSYTAESVNQRGELVARSINTIVNY